jgi:nitrogen fixation/metabolism regulation signal transduction histidine kinase
LHRRILNLRFRTRLALVMFLTMACTSAILMVAYVGHNRKVKTYVAGQTSDLLQIIQLTQARIPPTADRNQALDAYMKALKDAGLTSVTLASPSGEVVASTNPGQVGKTIKLKKRRVDAKQNPIKISAELRDIEIDPTIEQKPYLIEFPIVQGDRVLGYAQVRGEMDEVGEILRHMYVVRLGWTLVTMLAGMFAIVYLAFIFTKPLDTLVAGAECIAQGNLDVSLPVGTDEMGRLAETFNRMVERLRENRELQERLNEAEKSSLLGRFAATVAHEVRNSLNFINLSIDQIRAKHGGGDDRAAHEIQRNLRNVKDEIGRLNRLVNEFLAVGRQAPPELAPSDLRATLEEAVALVEKQASRQAIAIATDFPPGLPILQADSGQMKTCFLNILTNAIQAMPRGGEIRITARINGAGNGKPGAFEVRFADTGPGIPPEDREKVFAPYYSTKTTGFGLGLAITRKIVEDHGGRIYVAESDTPGAVIAVELPLPAPSVAQPAGLAKSPAA